MMKRVSIMLCIVLTLVGTSCDDYLDINENVNKPTFVEAPLVLPQALAATAMVLNRYNNYGMQIGGYAANAGGYGGFNETVSYAYTPNNYADLWPNSYDNLEDYQYVIDQTKDVPENAYYLAVAKIMKAYGFQLLVDAYNDVPYSEALQGSGFLTPKYDNAAVIYSSLAVELDEAMAAIVAGNAAPLINPIDDADIVFGGDMDKWLQLANTIKLRLMVRGGDKVTFANTDFNEVGFLTEDALINPGYTRDNNRQNPKWNTWAFAYTGSAGNKAWIPTTFALSFYDGTKLEDPWRGEAMFFEFPETGSNQLGYESTGIPKSPDGSFWYPSSNRTGTSAGDATGVLKGPDAGFPLMIAAESYFLQAEAAVRGIPTPAVGTAEELYYAGLVASFDYLYQLPDGSVDGDPESDVVDYVNENIDNPLVNFPVDGSTEQQIEAIITQKWLALNMVNSQEGWNEFRRTGYPKVSGTGATSTFASIASQSPNADKLPTRVLYPTSEIQYNPGNIPAGVTSFTSKIFWAK